MKKIVSLSLALLATLGAGAQSKLSSTITEMLSNVNRQIAEAQQVQRGMSLGSATALQECPVDTAAIQDKMAATFNADGTVKTVDVIAELAEGATCPTALLTSKGIAVTGEALGFVFLVVPAEQLEFLETLEEFVSLNANGVSKPMNDNSRKLLNISNVNGIDNAAYTYDTPYTGKGVVVGIIDSGIDYNHIAFKDSEGNSRVKKVVDYGSKSDGNVVTTPEGIAALTWDKTSASDKSHGTHVAATAAGSDLYSSVDYAAKTRNLMGMAPEADLVLCGINTIYDSRVMKSMEAIIATAKELGEPCVINMSFGTVGDWHDASYQINKAIDKVAGEGVIVCMSTGNDGMYNWTVEKTIPTGGDMILVPTKTVAVASSNRSYVPAQTIYVNIPNCTSTSAMSYSFEVVDSLTGAVTTLATKPLKNDTSGSSIQPTVKFSTVSDHQGWVQGKITITQGYFEENSKFLAIKLHNESGADLRAYAMSDRKVKVNNNDELCNSLASTDIPNYTYDKGTADASLNRMCSSENIISVGAYNRSRRFTAYQGSTYALSEAQTGKDNATAAFSCYGTDDFGKAHPDVIAPGTAVISAYNYYDTSKVSSSSVEDGKITLTGTDPRFIAAYYTDGDNKNHLWYENNGTSMATPMVTGTVALWLQVEPTLTPEKIREIITWTSRTAVNGNDITVSAGNTAQNRIQLGNGLIDAEAGIQYIITNIATSVKGIASNDAQQPVGIVKSIANGSIVIEKNGKHYNAAGQLVR